MTISTKIKKHITTGIMVAMVLSVAFCGYIFDDSPDDHQVDDLYAHTPWTQVQINISSTVPPVIAAEKQYNAGILELCFFLIDKPPPFYDDELITTVVVVHSDFVSVGRVLPYRFFCAVNSEYERNATQA